MFALILVSLFWINHDSGIAQRQAGVPTAQPSHGHVIVQRDK